MAFSTEVDVLTMEDIMPEVVDTVLRANEFTTRIMTKDTKKFRAATEDFPLTSGEIKSTLIYGEVPNYALA